MITCSCQLTSSLLARILRYTVQAGIQGPFCGANNQSGPLASYLLYTLNPGLLLQGKLLIFHFLLKQLNLCSSPTGTFAFASTIYHITKDIFFLCHLLCHSHNTGMTTTVDVYAEE